MKKKMGKRNKEKSNSETDKSGYIWDENKSSLMYQAVLGLKQYWVSSSTEYIHEFDFVRKCLGS